MSIGERTRSFLMYTAKCITGTIVVYLVDSFFPFLDVGWSLISFVLVLSPDGKDAVNLAVTRIKANIIGAIVGLLCLLIAPATAWMVSIALIGTILLCFVFRLEAGVRIALAGTILVMLRRSQYSWDAALERVIAVVIGCLVGMLSTYIFHSKLAASNQSAISHEEG